MEVPARALKQKLGEDGMLGLQSFVDEAGQRWKEDVLSIAAERFERRLAEELGAFRVEIAKEFATMRVELATMRADLLKWSFLFWIGQFAAVSAMMAFLLRTIGPR
jgi:hypothetical protein